MLEGSGSGDAGQEIWKPAMEEYLKGKARRPSTPPPADLVYGTYGQYGQYDGSQYGNDQNFGWRSQRGGR